MSLFALKWIFRGILILALLSTGFFALLAIGTVPAPNERNTEVVSGRLTSISAPHPEYGDMGIVIEGGYYYVNRANEVDYFEWEGLLAEVLPGDEIEVTVVRPLLWRWVNPTGGVNQGPLAGVRTTDKIYMDPTVAAQTWTAQAKFQRNFWVSLGLVGGVLVISRLVGKRKNSSNQPFL